ncbi:LOW QUALITY PROTEIN: uncharacterized protein LOC144350481 [Saccoglossus kowalevskii]
MVYEGSTTVFNIIIKISNHPNWPPYYNRTCETPTRESNVYDNYPFIAAGSYGRKDFQKSKKHKDTVGVDLNSKCEARVYFPYDDFNNIRQAKAMHVTLYDIELIFEDVISGRKEIVRLHNNPSAIVSCTIYAGVLRAEQFLDPVHKPLLVAVTFSVLESKKHYKFRTSVALIKDPEKHLMGNILEVWMIGCPIGKYGGNCQFDCLCKNGATCHGFNGACLCRDEWQGPACDISTPVRVQITAEKINVPLHGIIVIRCYATNVLIHKNNMQWYINDTEIHEDGYNIYNTRLQPRGQMLQILDAKYSNSGFYQTIVFSSENIYSNIIQIHVTGCRDNAWGESCEKTCNCEYASTCDQVNGCVCDAGWSGITCTKDVEAPYITNCPDNIVELNNENTDGNEISWPEIKATDNGNLFNISGNVQPGYTFPIGVTLVTYKATDDAENIAECRFTVTIEGDHLIILFIDYLHNGVEQYDLNQLRKGDLIGQGEFSMVYTGSLVRDEYEEQVAIKILKDDIEFHRAFIEEIKLLNELQEHPNIVRLIGVVIAPDEKCILTELMKVDLLTYLQGLQKDISIDVIRILRSVSVDIAEALNYMEHLKIVHRDIAARNVLMACDNAAKIADFGLARDIYQQRVYESLMKIGTRIPVRWMSSETLRDGVYTHMSDIWSYGVMLWEITSLGGTPYTSKQYTDIDHLVKLISEEDYRLPKPQRCSDAMYSLMRLCWKHDRKERPSASDIVSKLTTQGMVFMETSS